MCKKIMHPAAQQPVSFYCPGKEAALCSIVVNMILSFILFGKKDK